MLSVTRKWEEMCKSNPNTAPFEEWVRNLPETEDVDVNEPEDFDKLLMCMKPSQRATRYQRMKAFGNHFRVEDDASVRMLTYDSGIASVFQVSTEDVTDVSINYVGAVNFFLAFKSQFAPKCKRWHHGIGTLNGGKSQKKPKR
jgi:hypothetical protein